MLLLAAGLSPLFSKKLMRTLYLYACERVYARLGIAYVESLDLRNTHTHTHVDSLGSLVLGFFFSPQGIGQDQRCGRIGQ